MPKNGCTCQSGRDYDGSEFGPCEHCERESDREREHAAMQRDAARWRISRVVYPRLMDSPQGYFCVDSSDDFHVRVSVGIQPHPVTKETSVDACILGCAATEGVAIDRMFVALNAFVDGGAVLPAEIEGPRKLAVLAQVPDQPRRPQGSYEKNGRVYDRRNNLIEVYEGQWRQVMDGARDGWWRFNSHYDRDGYCDNPARGY